jgi:hypothetical protein
LPARMGVPVKLAAGVVAGAGAEAEPGFASSGIPGAAVQFAGPARAAWARPGRGKRPASGWLPWTGTRFGVECA